MIEVGRLCVKIAGRDAGKRCVIVEIVDKNRVLIDGETRRRKCSIRHIEAIPQVVQISSGASHDIVVSEFKKLGIEIKPKAVKERKTAGAKQEAVGSPKAEGKSKETKKTPLK